MSNSHIPIIFENETGRLDEHVFIHFLNGAFGDGQTGADGKVKLTGNTAYSLKVLKSKMTKIPALGEAANISLNDFTNGRIYISIGKALTGLGSGYQPSSANPSDPNYKTSYGYIEPNVFGNSQNNLDFTYITFYCFPFAASTWKEGKQVAALDCKSYLFNRLSLLTKGKAAVPAERPVRVLGPLHTNTYHDWSSYFKHLESMKTYIGGEFGGLGGSGKDAAQSYSLIATFDGTSQEVTISGTCSVVGDTTIKIKYSDMNALTGVYGANPPYKISNDGKTSTTTGITNDVFGWIVGDLLAGLNFGFPGSETKIKVGGKEKSLQDATSSEWIAAAKEDASIMFDGAQSNPEFYNQYASVVMQNTDAYGFAFSDRVEQPLLYFGPNEVDYLKISIYDIADV